MIVWGALLLLFAACWITGVLITRHFTGGRMNLAVVFAALTLGVVVNGWLALVLAEFGQFRILPLALTWSATLFALIAFEWWRKRRGRWPARVEVSSGAAAPIFAGWPVWAERAFLLGWLVAALWLFCRPHEYVLGASDAGVYVSLGASIARQGSILIEDATLAALDAELMPGLLRPQPDNPVAPYYLLPGFYVDGEPPGEITPQFYPLYPVMQAVAYRLATLPASDELMGIRAMLLMNGVWATLGALAVYLAVRQFAGWETAALALVALSVTALQVWFARYPTTEMLTQYLLWSGLLGLGLWLGGDRPSPLWALLAGASLGAVYLVRVDLLVLLPVLALLALWLVGTRRESGRPVGVLWFLIPLGLLIVHSFIHAWWQSRPYFVVHSGLGLRLLRVNWVIPVTALVVAVVFIWLLRRAGPRFSAGYARYRRYAVAMLIGVTIVFAVFGWFVRPVIGEIVARPDLYSGATIPLSDHENWRRLGWYLSPLGVWLGVAGICIMIWQVNRRTVMILATGALFAALYLWSLRANPQQVYAMRRFVPAAVPFFTLAAAVVVGALARRPARRARMVALALAVAWLGSLVWSARGFVSQVDHQGLAAQLNALNDTLEPASVLLFYDGVPIGNGDFFGTPLRFIYGHDAFAIRDPSLVNDADLVRAVKLWQNSGRAVYWIGDPAWPVEQGLAVDTTEYVLTSSRLEQSYDHKPATVIPDTWRLRLSRIRPDS